MNILGKSECTAYQMAQYLIARNPNAKSWALEYAQIYLEEGEVEGVRGDGAWIQSCKETHYFIFDCGTAVTFDQNNFCGLGVTKKGMKGHSFETPRLGIRAQIQHLKGYATSKPLKNPCVDPRYKYVKKGCSPTFELLAGKWAVPGYDTSKASSLQDAMNKKIGYGFDIISGIEAMKKIKDKGSDKMGKNVIAGYISDVINGIKVNSSIRANSSNYRIKSKRQVNYIVMHYTGNASDKAVNNANYFKGANRNASAHFFVDNTSIYQSVALKDVAWHCGASKYYHASCRNDNAIGIEMCCSGKYIVSEKTKENAEYLCAHLCKLLGISANEVDTYVLRHYDCSHKLCPKQMAGNNNSEWKEFKEKVKRILGSTYTPTTPSTPTSTPSTPSASTSNSINKFVPLKGNPTHFAEIIKNIKIALNVDYGLKFTIDSGINNILLINLGNVILSTASYKPNITYALQQLLRWWGYDILIDGIYGNGTKNIISLFQSQVGISKTGTTTKEFWYKVLGK